MAKCLIATVISYLLSSGTVLASKYAGEFLTLGMGARAAGLGGAYSSIANDATAPYWNPAGVSLVNRKEIMGMHSEIFGGAVRYDCIGIVFPADNSAFGANLFLLSIRNIKFTEDLEHEDFGLDGIDGTGDQGEHNGELDPGELIIYDERRIQSVTNNDVALFLSYGWAFSDKLSFGVGLKMIRREIGDYSAYCSGADLGIIYRPAKTVSLGLNLQDATTTFISWSTGTWERILPTLKFGVSTNHWVEGLRGTLLFSIDQDIRFEGRRRTSQFSVGRLSDDFRLGVEYLYSEVVGIRVGLEYRELTAGIGVRYRNYLIDYAFLSHPDLYGSYRLSLSAAF